MSKQFNSTSQSTCQWESLTDGRVQCTQCKTIRSGRRKRVCRTEEQQAALLGAHRTEQSEARAARQSARQATARTTTGSTPLPQGRFARLSRWLTAITRWAWQSYKARRLLVREEAEYRRVRAICEACPNWEPDKEQCKICGCGGRSKVVLLNKLRIGTEHCPEGKW
jgi:recombinational DNA repair protein RecR